MAKSLDKGKSLRWKIWVGALAVWTAAVVLFGVGQSFAREFEQKLLNWMFGGWTSWGDVPFWAYALGAVPISVLVWVWPAKIVDRWGSLTALQRLAVAGFAVWSLALWSEESHFAEGHDGPSADDLRSWVWPVGFVCVVVYLLAGMQRVNASASIKPPSVGGEAESDQ